MAWAQRSRCAGSLARKNSKPTLLLLLLPADVIFGLGKRTKVDAVRVLWPAGIVQAETEIANIKSPITLTELDRKPSSCPYLYVWNGERVLCSSPISWVAAKWAISMRRVFTTRRTRMSTCASAAICCGNAMDVTSCVTNELEEAMFMDQLQLVAVAHPQDTEVYPNEGLTVPPQPFKIYSARRSPARGGNR